MRTTINKDYYMSKDIRRRMRKILTEANVEFRERDYDRYVYFDISTKGRCDGVSIHLGDESLTLWVQDGWLDTPPGAGLADVYDEFSREWTKEHPGFSGHLMNPFRESGGAPACKATYPIPSTSHELAELVKYQILGKDVETALGFCRAIKEYAR